MQELLHHALASPHTFGLLAGRGSTIEAVFPVTENMHMESGDICNSPELQLAQLETKSLTLMGVYQATDSDGNVDPGQVFQLSRYFEKYSGVKACCYLLLELGTEGRLDALMFSDQEHSIPIPLDMQED
jgi:hypothetical protein